MLKLTLKKFRNIYEKLQDGMKPLLRTFSCKIFSRVWKQTKINSQDLRLTL